MKCLRCGYCCKHLAVIIIDDPLLGPVENNLILHDGQGQACKHLLGDKPGAYSCALHDYDWYSKTPCYQYTQIENGNEPCRMGKHLLNRLKENQNER